MVLEKKTFLNFFDVFSLFRHYLPTTRAEPFIWTNLSPHHPRMLCAKFGWNWFNGSGEKKYHPFCMSKCKYVLHVFHFENFSSPELIFVTHWAFFIVIFFSVLWDWGRGPKNLENFGTIRDITWKFPETFLSIK